MSLPEIKSRLADIDIHIRAVAAGNPVGSDHNEIAHAIRNLCEVVSDLAADIEGLLDDRQVWKLPPAGV